MKGRGRDDEINKSYYRHNHRCLYRWLVIDGVYGTLYRPIGWADMKDNMENGRGKR